MSKRAMPLLLLIGIAACAKPDPSPANLADSAGAAAPASQATATSASTDTTIVVNGVVLPPESVRQLQQLYPVPIPAGRYWYDAVSGGYGREGEPIAGQMIPGLQLGGALAENASAGTSGVYINGRQLTGGEKLYIERLCQTPVVPGRYWVLATGVGGYEGGPAYFNLAQCPGVPQPNSGARSMSRTYCDANGACTSTGILGSIMTVPD